MGKDQAFKMQNTPCPQILPFLSLMYQCFQQARSVAEDLNCWRDLWNAQALFWCVDDSCCDCVVDGLQG